MKEIELMKSIGRHPNIVSIIGCVSVGEPLCLVVEHVPQGDLLHYLRRHRSRLSEVWDERLRVMSLYCIMYCM